MSNAKQFVVFGIGRFGASLCKTLCDLGHEVLAVDGEEEVINDIAPFVTQAIQMDATDEDALKKIGLRNFDAAVVSIGDNVRDSILVSLLCKEAGVKYVISKATDELHAKVLRKVGVDKVVFPERDMGIRVAKSLIAPNVVDLINLTDEYAIESIQLPDHWVGKTVREIEVRRKYGVTVLLLQRGEDVLIEELSDTRLLKGDVLMLLGHKHDVEKIESLP